MSGSHEHSWEELERLRRAAVVSRSRQQPTERRSLLGPVSIAPVQEGLWFEEEFSPNEHRQNYCLAYLLKGPLELGPLQAAVRHTVAQHSVLWSAFIPNGASALLERRDPSRIPVVVLDRSGQESSIIIEDFLRTEARESCDVRAGANCRWTILRFSPTSHAMVFTTHHICFDAVSHAVLLEELTFEYQRLLGGEVADVAARKTRLQYEDFAAWQREWVEGPAGGRSLQFWQDHLAPARFPEPVGQRKRIAGGQCETIFFSLSRDQTRRVRAVARMNSITVCAVLFAAYRIVLEEECPQYGDITGVAASGRMREEHECVVGLFANVLPIHLAVKDRESLRDVATQAHTILGECLEHQGYPLVYLTSRLAKLRQGRGVPFRATFSYMVDPGEVWFGLVHAEKRVVPAYDSPFSLMLFLRETAEDSIGGELLWQTDALNAEVPRKIVAGLRKLLATAVLDA